MLERRGRREKDCRLSLSWLPTQVTCTEVQATLSVGSVQPWLWTRPPGHRQLSKRFLSPLCLTHRDSGDPVPAGHLMATAGPGQTPDARHRPGVQPRVTVFPVPSFPAPELRQDNDRGWNQLWTENVRAAVGISMLSSHIVTKPEVCVGRHCLRPAHPDSCMTTEERAPQAV